jgi:pimeloyl-ACP methyl ester carboxylesterase
MTFATVESERRVMLTTAAIASMAASAIAQTPAVKNVVLVHGAFADGSGWRGVYDGLTRRGYQVTIVQNPLTSLADDVAATRRALDRQEENTHDASTTQTDSRLCRG